MPCIPIGTEDGRVTGIVCTRTRRKRERCRWCSSPATRLCDGRVDGGTCDAPCCRAHATAVDRAHDLCPECARDPQLELELGAR